jgi:hypothetical protein
MEHPKILSPTTRKSAEQVEMVSRHHVKFFTKLETSQPQGEIIIPILARCCSLKSKYYINTNFFPYIGPK